MILEIRSVDVLGRMVGRRGFWDLGGNVLFLLSVGYTVIFSWVKFIKLYNYAL